MNDGCVRSAGLGGTRGARGLRGRLGSHSEPLIASLLPPTLPGSHEDPETPPTLEEMLSKTFCVLLF